MANQPQYLTPEGLKELESRLKYLQEVRRYEVADRLRQVLDEPFVFLDDSAQDRTELSGFRI